jgi:hydrogenase maturation protein HypF
MAEHGVDELIGVTCDGYGYGADGSAWGGEIMYCQTGSTEFKRLGHLESQPLLGGDIATRYPLRMATGILSKKLDVSNWLLDHSKFLRHGEMEAKLILSQLGKSQSLSQTTSLGRVLDAAAAVIGICYERTYEGEAAMKLESTAILGKDVLELPIVACGNLLDTTQMLVAVWETRDKYSPQDLAFTVHTYLAKGLAMLAVEKAINLGVGAVGFTGGSAVNSILARLMREVVEAEGLKFLVNEQVPPGDGGVALGQACVGGF